MEALFASHPKSSSGKSQKKWKELGPLKLEDLVKEGKLHFDETVGVQQNKSGNSIRDGQLNSEGWL